MKKTVALLLAAAMCVTAMAGCSGQPQASSQGTASSLAEMKIENFNETGYPIVNEPITMTMWGISHPNSTNTWKENLAMQFMEKNSNIHFEYTEVSQDGAEEKRALLFAGNDLPDVFFRSSLTTDEIIRGGTEGVLIPLQDMIPKYAPNTQALFDRIDGMKGALATPDGNIYTLGQVPISTPTNHYVINKKWLDNLGLAMPTDLDSFYNVLKAFKEKDANGNGDPNDEIPFSVVGFNGLKKFLNSWGIITSGGDHDMFIYPGTEKVSYAYTQDSFKEALIYLNKLYKEGLLDQELLVQDSTAYSAKGNANTLGTLYVAGAFVNVGEALHFDYDGLEPFKDQNGNQYTVANVPVGPGHFAITKNCKYPEAALRWIDYLYSEEGAILTFAGIENETYKWIDDDTWEWIVKDGESMVTMRANNTIQGGLGYPGIHPDFFPKKFWAHQNNEFERSLDEKRESQNKYIVTVYPKMFFTSEENSEVTFILTDIENYVKQSIADFITGQVDIEQGWGSYLDTVKTMGVDKAVEIYQTKYDQYMEQNK